LYVEEEKSKRYETLACKLMEELSSALINGSETMKTNAVLASRETELREVTQLYENVKVNIDLITYHIL
jgi:hypothetical protein